MGHSPNGISIKRILPIYHDENTGKLRIEKFETEIQEMDINDLVSPYPDPLQLLLMKEELEQELKSCIEVDDNID